jgi:beta-lactamase regulating signal transducer with metallopeptidase domain
MVAQAPVSEPLTAMSLDKVLIAVWLAGAVASLVYIVVTYLIFRRQIRRDAVPVTARVRTLFEECRLEMKIRRPVRLMGISGLLTPAIFVPATVTVPMELVAAMDDRQLKLALRHELTHYKRKDHLLSVWLLILQAVYWFNPFVWLGFRQMRADMEVACDSAVTRQLDGEGKSEYAGMIVSMFSKGASGHLVLGMARGGSKQEAEKRIRGIFAKRRSQRSAVLVSALLVAVLVVGCFTTACQPTPEQPVVAAKNAGVLEKALAEEPSAKPTPYEGPARLALDIDVPSQNYSIVFDAEVVVPSQTAYPVYDVALSPITQAQADAVRLALLDGATLYKPGNVRSRAEVQRNIDYYETELKGSAGYPQLIDAYTEILKKLYVEYENSPKDLALEEADTTLQFDEGFTDAMQYGGKEVQTENGGLRFEWTEAARQKAAAAGVSSVFGVCWMESGRKMQLSVRNEGRSSGLYFGYADGNAVYDQCDTCTLDQAIDKGDAIIAEAGFDFSLVSAETQTSNLDDEGNEVAEYARFHTLIYKRNIPGVPLDNIQSSVSQNLDELTGEAAYRGLVPYPETIMISIDDLGVISFDWSQPLTVTATQNENVPLIPFDKISERVATQLKIQTMWSEEADAYDAEWIESRRLEVDKIVLSYLVVAKANDFSSFFMIPVWNICGDLYYHYKDGYSERGGGFVLDENNERSATRQHVGDTSDHSLLTISAIDGTVIPRQMHT